MVSSRRLVRKRLEIEEKFIGNGDVAGGDHRHVRVMGGLKISASAKGSYLGAKICPKSGNYGGNPKNKMPPPEVIAVVRELVEDLGQQPATT